MAAMAMLSLSFGRFGGGCSVSFPESCSTSAQETCDSLRRKYDKYNSRFYPTWLVSAAASGNAGASLPDGVGGPGEFLLAEVRKRREELASLIKDGSDKSPFWKDKLPLWAVRKLQKRELTKKIMELSRMRRLKEVFELLESAKGKKLVNRKTMNAVMEACVHCGDIHRTVELFQCMVLPDACGVDEITYGTLIKGLGKAGMLDAAFHILESMDLGTAPGKPRLSIIHLNTLINACANVGDARRARGALKRYKSVIPDAGPSLVTYNMLIKGYARSENPLEALKVKEEMQLRGAEPNKLTWNSLILACVRGQDMDMALQTFAEMKEAAKLNVELEPDVVTYTTLIKGFADAGDLNGVLNVAADMKTVATCEMDRVGYTAIIDACIAAGAPADALAFFEELESLALQDRRLRPRTHAYLALMRAFSETGQVDKVSLLKSRMVIGSSGRTWPEDRLEAEELLIEAAVNSGQLSLGQSLLKTTLGFQKELHLSERGYMAIVRLQALTGFSDNVLSPLIICPQLSVEAPLESILPQMTTLRPLSSSDKLENVVLRFYNEDVLPVADASGTCLGSVHAKDCDKVDLFLTSVMRDPPPMLPSSVSIRTVIESLIQQPPVPLLGVESDSSKPVRFFTRRLVFDFLQNPK